MFLSLSCQSWHLVLLIDLRQLSVVWQQVRESETTGIMEEGFLNLVKLLLYSLWNRERQTPFTIPCQQVTSLTVGGIC